MTETKFEELRGKTYPDTLEEQLKTLETDDTLQRFKVSRQRLAADPYRPLYHFSPPENLIGDPCGLCQWQGRYHMFYQFRPEGQDRVHWGHTVSDDLVHWRDLPPAYILTRKRTATAARRWSRSPAARRRSISPAARRWSSQVASSPSTSVRNRARASPQLPTRCC